jgi:hypothetical protein
MKVKGALNESENDTKPRCEAQREIWMGCFKLRNKINTRQTEMKFLIKITSILAFHQHGREEGEAECTFEMPLH